jgi:hypothetical protein
MLLRKLFFAILLTAVLANQIFAQKQYFQQEVNSRIEVTLNDVDHTLSAFIDIEYINNSPDELSFIYMHLWPNAYKNNETALAKQLIEQGNLRLYNSEEKDRGFIDSLNFKVDGKAAKWNLIPQHIDIAVIYLERPLKPGGKINISTPFFVKIPKGVFSRLGHLGQAYQITQWYPKPAVYDRKGWHQMPYLTQGEFYSEYGSFDVSITLPANYVVGATGDLVNGEKELEWLMKKVEKTKAIEEFPRTNEHPPSAKETKTLRYKQSNVHDFAWFTDKRWHVLKGEVELPQSKRKVDLWAMFTNNEADLWMKSIEYLHDATYYYSLWNGDYPYNQVTAVDGALTAGAGMEYPNVTVIGQSGTAFDLETVIVHEVGHNWFYGIIGSHERLHPWMDEGINSFNELRYIRNKYPEAGIQGISENSSLAKTFDLYYPHHRQYQLFYLLSARKNTDQPIELPAHFYTSFNYGAIVYSKTAAVFDYLRAYLGEQLFDSVMHSYYDRWKFKHPYPEDLEQVFKEITNLDLSWFFNDIIKTTGKIDYKIQSLKRSPCTDNSNETCYELKIKNVGDIASPLAISAVKNDSVIGNVWIEGFSGSQTITIKLPQADRIILDAENYLPQINTRNGFARTSGIFKTKNPIKFQFLGSIEHPVKRQIFYTPIVGWNNYNKLMVGAAFYNNTLPQKRFEYLIAPMYSFGTNREAGIVNLNYNFYPAGVFQHIRFGVNYEKFAISNLNFDQHYQKFEPKIVAQFRKEPRSSKNTFLKFRNINIHEDYTSPVFTADRRFAGYQLQTDFYTVRELEVLREETRKINPYNMRIFFHQGDRFLRANMEVNYLLSSNRPDKGLRIRFFAGYFFYNSFSDPRFNFGMAGNRDYTYDHVLLDRNRRNPVLGNQFPLNDGGFKNLVTVPSSDEWLTALNLKYSLPGKIPLALYADLGFAPSSRTLQVYSAWNTGVALVIVPEFFEIYFPVAMSSDLNQLTYFQKVRFILNIHTLNPFNRIRKLEL